MTSLFVSASTTASCTHFMAVSKSTISLFRTPRDGAWPTPRILIVPSGRPSPTTTQILDVPISRPTIKLLLAMVSLIRFVSLAGSCLGNGRRTGARLGRGRRRFFGRTHRDCLHDPRFYCGLNRVVNDGCRRLGKCHGNVSLDKQVYSPEFLF